MAKTSYVDPRVVDLSHGGCTIEPALLEIGDGALKTTPQEPRAPARAQFSSCSRGARRSRRRAFR